MSIYIQCAWSTMSQGINETHSKRHITELQPFWVPNTSKRGQLEPRYGCVTGHNNAE